MSKKQCPTCKQWFKSLGFASHRAKHYNEKARKEARAKEEETKKEIKVCNGCGYLGCISSFINRGDDEPLACPICG